MTFSPYLHTLVQNITPPSSIAQQAEEKALSQPTRQSVVFFRNNLVFMCIFGLFGVELGASESLGKLCGFLNRVA